MRRQFLSVPIVLGAAMALAACGAMTQKDERAAQVEDRSTAMQGDQGPGGAGGVTTGGMASSGFQGHPLDDPNSPLSSQVIYFDFDKSEIKPEYRDIVEAHARYLANNPSATVTLEGHADERGTREYNIALGDRRAGAVQRLMSVLGASGQQVRTVSYGEERPAADGHGERAWSKNRRVEIIYRNRG
ncbi:MAG: peptidoglycan-associated lipoprotein Pal [Gammaproteobacteria bacterium]|nr:peptidoglycan-associated lipoprotein Pal [Gammaproteobacteria bacterium]